MDVFRRFLKFLRESASSASELLDPDAYVLSSAGQREQLHCLDAEDALFPCTLIWTYEIEEAHIGVDVPEAGGIVDASGHDLFDAFLSVRHALEADGLRLVCGGARRDCWASGMARQMGVGDTVYVLSLGQPARLSHQTSLFAPASPGHVTTVEKQRAHYEVWKASLSESQLY